MPKLDLLDIENYIGLPNILVEVSSPNRVLKETGNSVMRGHTETSVFRGPMAQKLKLDMEIFEDLSSYCQSKGVGVPAKTSQNTLDELNTPVFEKAPFDYVRQSFNETDFLNVTISAEDPFSYKIKSELSNISNVNIENNLIQEPLMEGASRDIASSPIMGEPTESYISRGINSNSYVFYPNNSEYEDIYYNSSDRVTPISTALINDEDEYLPTVGNCSEIYINNSNSCEDTLLSSNPNNEYLIIQTAQFETPDNSRSASEYSDARSPTLQLEIGRTIKTEDIDTPQIIDTITSLENDKLVIEDSNFNIFNFITDEDIATSESLLTSKLDEFPKPQQTQIKKYKHKDDDDDDEDYEPPSAKRFRSHCLTEEGIIPRRRGRPPKRKESISSEEYCETTGKYREMRDKNNEASRKSRLKRKIKELEHEEEANALLEKNIKLRAQVQELEKTVTNFRTNLMQILLKK